MRFALVAVFAPLALGACATKPLATGPCMNGTQVSSPGNLLGGFQSVSYDAACGRDAAVRAMIVSPDIGLRTTGTIVAAQQDARVTNALPIARDAITNPNGIMRCTAGTPVAGTGMSTPARDVPLRCDVPLVTVEQSRAPDAP